MAAFDDDLPHLLFAAFAEVPGPTAVGTRLVQLIGAFSDEFDVDAMSLKGRELAHIQRLGTARMLRVPVEEMSFFEGLGAYSRALGRQLGGDTYQLVYCADVFSAQVAAAYREAAGFKLILEVEDLPSESFGTRWPVDAPQGEGKPPPAPDKLKARWREIEKQALRAADVVVVSSRYAAHQLSERVDPRRLLLLPRAVDRTVFRPPTMEVSGQRRPSVVVLGARAEGGEQERAVALLYQLASRLPDEVEVILAAQGRTNSEELDRLLEGTVLEGRVRKVDLDSPVRLANALVGADVVVVPNRPQAGATPLGVPHRVLEAMSCGRPVVLAGATPALQGQLEPGVDLVVTEAVAGPGDATPVAEAVAALLADEGRRVTLGKAGARYAGDHGDLARRTEELAELISSQLGVTMHPRSPEATLGADPTDPTGVGEAAPKMTSTPSEVDPASESQLPMVSDVQLLDSQLESQAEGQAAIEISSERETGAFLQVPRMVSMPDSAAGPVSIGRFSADRLLSEEGHALDDEASDPWGGDTELQGGDRSAPPGGAPAGLRAGPAGASIPGFFSTETDLRPRDGLSELSPAPAAGEHEPQSTETFRAPHTAEQGSAERTQIGGAEARRLLAAEQALAGKRDTAVAIRPDVDTETAQYDELIRGVTDPRLHRAGTDTGLSPSALASLEAEDEESHADEWAPDTVFDARPVFHSGEQSKDERRTGTEDGSGDGDTVRNPVSSGRTQSSARGQDGSSGRGLLVDDEEQ